jgi:hypothetical protein
MHDEVLQKQNTFQKITIYLTVGVVQEAEAETVVLAHCN